VSLLVFVLLIAAFILFVLAALNVGHPRVNLIAAGLGCWVLAVLLGGGLPPGIH
jgi:hypothetical protein